MEMNKMRKIYSLLIASIFLLVACEKDEIQMWDSGNYVQFAEEYKDSLTYSFFFYGTQEEIKVPLNMQLVGLPLANDARVSLSVNQALTTAEPDSYLLDTEPVFRKDVLEDTAYLLLKKTALLDTEEVRLVIDIVANETLKPGQSIYSRKVIRFSSLVSQPLWWDEVVEESLLGEYTEKKFRLFMEVTGVGDLTGYSESERWSMARKFKYYLIEQEEKGNPVKDEDGADMTVPVIG